MTSSMASKTLYRSNNALIGGVCAGIAEYFGWNANALRFAVAFLSLPLMLSPAAIYLVLWMILPRRPTDYRAYVNVAPERMQDARAHASAGPASVQAMSDASVARRPSRRLAITVVVALCASALVALVLSGILDRPWVWIFLSLVAVAIGFYLARARATDSRSRASIVIDGVLVIALGAVLLLCSTGVLSWGLLASLAFQWPFVLVAAGTCLIATALRSSGLHILSAAIAFVMLGAGLCNFAMGTSLFVDQYQLNAANLAAIGQGKSGVEPAAQVDLSGSDLASLEINAGTSSVNLTSGGGTIASLFTSDGIEASDISYDSELSRLRIGDSSIGLVGTFGVQIPQGVTWSSVVLAGAAYSASLNLSQVKLQDMYVEASASTVSLTFGEAAQGGSAAYVEGSFSQVSLTVPEDVPCVIMVDLGNDVLNRGGLDKGIDGRTVVYRSEAAEEVAADADVWQVYIHCSRSRVTIDEASSDSSEHVGVYANEAAA